MSSALMSLELRFGQVADRGVSPPDARWFAKRLRRVAALRIVAALLIVALAAAPAAAVELGSTVVSRDGVVVAVSPPAVEAGALVLAEGGNAVDAAVTVAFAMAVTHPAAGNIGGGGFMMVYSPGGEAVCIEYRETAPAASTPDMFQLGETRFGHKVVGTPGTVAGMKLAHQRYGKLPWSHLVAPAVALARQGFPLDAPQAASLNALLRDEGSREMRELQRVFAPPTAEGWKAGDILRQPDLAGTLEQIRDQGPDGFYRGPVADLIVAEMQRGGGLMTKDDLAGYEARVRPAVRGTFRGLEIFGAPPPSSGGTALVQMLNTLERFPLKEWGRWSPQTSHVLLEAMKRAYLDRARYLGDPDFVEIPARLTEKTYAAELAESIDPERATPAERLAGAIPLVGEGDSTTHFSVVDRDGLAVSNTYTLEFSYGSRVVVAGAGFLLNNEMGDFNWKPGHTDRRGAIGTPANVIAPGKRMLSSQSPTIVVRDGRAVLITGSPGGRTIINTVLNVTLNVLEFEMSPEAAVAAPRWHQAWMPDAARFEGAGDPQYAPLLEELRGRGHKIDERSGRQGDAHTIVWDPQQQAYIGVSDRRILGAAGKP